MTGDFPCPPFYQLFREKALVSEAGHGLTDYLLLTLVNSFNVSKKVWHLTSLITPALPRAWVPR